MDKPTIRTLAYQRLGIAQTVETDSLMDFLIDDVIIDILGDVEFDLTIKETTVASITNQAWALLPTDCAKPSKVWKNNIILEKLMPGQYWERRAVNSATSEPTGYSLLGLDSATGQRRIYFEPVPNGIYTYNLPYYALLSIMDVSKIPVEYHLLIVVALCLQLMPDKDSTTGGINQAKIIAKAEYDARLNQIKGLEARTGDELVKSRVDASFRLKQHRILKRGAGAGFHYPWN